MGERKLATGKAKKAVAVACQEAAGRMTEAADEAMRVQTPGGVFSVRWDERGSATALGQLAFFAEYLEATGLFEAWLKSCPLSYTSPNAPALVDVLGTWMLSILDGHCRYAHVGALRGDGVAPSILGMTKIIGQLYRDRADCENGFDEIKNQWGWGGYSTHDIERCALSARAVALIYNWWSWYVRLAHPKTRLEAITSRPKQLSAVGRMTSHAGQKKILLTITHEAATQIKALVANVRHGLCLIQETAPQLDNHQRWFALVRYIVERILACAPKPSLGLTALGTG